MHNKTFIVRFNTVGYGFANGSWDWVATEDNYDCDDPVGYGPTPQDALEDLLHAIECREYIDNQKEKANV